MHKQQSKKNEPFSVKISLILGQDVQNWAYYHQKYRHENLVCSDFDQNKRYNLAEHIFGSEWNFCHKINR